MQFSHQSLRSYVRKLHLEPGDCLIVSHADLLKQLQRMPAMNFHVPVIFAPDGQRIGQIVLPETASNICFGGPKRNRLFITASQSLYAVYVETQGAHIA